jgi:hypothetical protein
LDREHTKGREKETKMPEDHAISATGQPHVKAKVTVTVTVLVTFLVSATFLVGSHLGPARSEVDAASRENARLVARQQALRDAAFDLAERVRWSLDEGRRLARLAGTSDHPWDVECPLPPAQEAGNEEVLAWLSELGSVLEPSERPVLPEPPGTPTAILNRQVAESLRASHPTQKTRK